MFWLNFLILLLAGIGGLYLGVVGFRKYRKITATDEKVSILQIIKIAACFGGAGSLIFLGIINFASLIDEEYLYSLQSIGNSIIICLILGFLITLGALYQIYTTVVFRDMLIRTFKKKDKS